MRRIIPVAVVVGLLAAAGAPAAAEVEGAGVSGPLPVDAFARIEAGMGEQQVVMFVGLPSAEGEYTPRMDRILAVVGMGDGPRRTYFYRGLGRVLFEGGNPLLRTGTVVRVEIDANEPGTAR